jgi:hypothetical protein
MEGICIYVYNSLNYEAVNIRELCTDKAMEACATKCKFLSRIFSILAICRSPSSNFPLFITKLEALIKISTN